MGNGESYQNSHIFFLCTSLTALRVLLHPPDKFFFGHYDPAADFEHREICFVH